ncbi:MAG: DUF493 family protein [Candidatus Methylacidiphilales bacterium]|nr:DUF493 family protein [Candidatus Methylacidiphilales bacterium]
MPTEDAAWSPFAEKLAAHHTWPCCYVFKCVVPAAQTAAARALLPGNDITARESSGGKYTALTCSFEAQDASVVVALYRSLSSIEGIVLL